MTEVATVTVAPRGSSLAEMAELLVTCCFEGEAPEVGGMAEEVRRATERLAARPGWLGKDDQAAQTDLGGDAAAGTSRAPAGATAQSAGTVALCGLGPRHELTHAKLARRVGRLAEEARRSGVRRLAVVLPLHAETTGEAAERVLRVLALACHREDRFRQDEDGRRLSEVAVVPPAGEEAAYRAAVRLAATLSGAAGFARHLANTPPNQASPPWMEEQARALAADRRLSVTVLDAAELARRGMGGLLAVGSGSRHPPRLVRLTLGGDADPRATPRFAVVGKGITFDTGGISLKPAPGMELLKFDKSGACVAMGVIRAAADLDLPLRLDAYLPFAENMPGGGAYRPGDIVRCANGRTVEITNTDAEGRMILADALTWASSEAPEALIEYSTLTRSCVIALGHQAAGLFTPDESLAGELLRASAASGERLWRLPLYPEHLEEMKSLHADLRNLGDAAAGASTAAAFLSQFMGPLRSWAHLDINGVAYLPSEEEHGSYATGFGVAATVHWLRERVGRAGR